MTLPTPFPRWRAQVLAARSERWRPERDRAFWARHAAEYDHNMPPLPQTVAWLRARLTGLESLLDVGAGTGRLLLPLADVAARVTALDPSPHMLEQLRGKHPPGHVQVREQCLAQAAADPGLPPHDAVLVAWALAYEPELETALRRLLTLTRRDLYLLEDDGEGSPHVRLRREARDQTPPRRATLLAEALAALGLPCERCTIPEELTLTFPSTAALLEYCRLLPPEAETLRCLAPFLTPCGEGWRYRWTFAVHVLHVPLGGRA
ncbi:hypothetical protein Dcar01_02927 [Deinococcus carri]|uniref:Methyltransferase domain-containing protein n=1 Tax=Deinococcus carri TaxID=1211323 RepID=A0ABP9WA27_9DEIO